MRVTCLQNEDTSTFYFRYWDKGTPEAIGEDTITDVLQQFTEEFEPDEERSMSFQLEVDFNRLIEDSLYPVKRFPIEDGAQ